MKVRKIRVLALAMTLLITQFGFVSPASAAATCVVDNFTDGAGSDANGSRTLRFCISDISDGGTITFSHGSTAQIIEVSSSLAISGKVITIDGDELITVKRAVGAAGSFSLLTSDSNLIVDGMTFQGGSATDGGAINIGSRDITISNSRFLGNSATDDGGAIYADDGTVTDSSFTGNSAADDGGAIHASDDFTFRDSFFENNTAAGDGGAIYSDGDVVLEDSLLISNTAAARGGAIFADSDINPTRTSFVSNTAANGGAYFVDANDTDIIDSYFAFNQASGVGGAIRVEQHIRITNSTFYQNTSGGNGGAVFNNNVDTDTGYIRASTFVDNTSGAGQSVIYWGQDNVLNLFANLFLGDPGQRQLDEAFAGRTNDFGWNVASDNNLITSQNSNGAITLASVGAGTPATATLSLRPIVPFTSLSATGVEINQAALDSWETYFGSALTTTDQQGTTRVVSFFPGAQFVAFVAAGPPVIAIPPYEGPVIQEIIPNFESTNEAKVIGLRMETVDEVSVDGRVLPQRFDLDGALFFDTSSLPSGTYRVEFWSGIARATLYSTLTIVTASETSQPATDAKLNAGSFNGYVAVYARGYKGATLSWKIAGVWFKTTITEDYVVFQRRTIDVGATVNVELYINGQRPAAFTKSIVTR